MADETIIGEYKKRTLYQGPDGGKYYKRSSGSKRYFSDAYEWKEYIERGYIILYEAQKSRKYDHGFDDDCKEEAYNHKKH